jgi:hypothetical protein
MLVASCSKGYNKGMKLPEDPQAVSELGWAVVKTAYAKLKTAPDSTSPEAGLVRGRSVFQCTARSIDPKGLEKGGVWYRFPKKGSKAGCTKTSWTYLTPRLRQKKQLKTSSADNKLAGYQWNF